MLDACTRARRLSDKQDARVDSLTHDRTRPEWQVRHTCLTGTHVNQNASSEERECLFRTLHFQVIVMKFASLTSEPPQALRRKM
jgi:hypothetical protein